MEVINIVIVDDRADNIMVLESALEREGINLYSCTSPKDVPRLCIDKHIDIALIDVNMPEMNGFDLLDIIKKDPATQHILVVLITGYSMDSTDVVNGLRLGAVDYLFKPLDLYIITAKIDSLINLVNYQREINAKNTELQHYQQKLLEAIEKTQKSKMAKENFLANMSHELRTPSNAIIGLTYLLKEPGLNDQQSELVKLLDYSANSLLNLVNDILEISKIDAGKITLNNIETDIIKLIHNICDSMRPMALSKGLELICEVGHQVPQFVVTDPLRLHQILVNLLNNAIKFTTSGKVKLLVTSIESKEDEALIKFTVEDTGVGIPKELINGIFTRFEQLENNAEEKFGGSGLGLSIVKKLVELQDGHLQVESEVGVGSKFSFSNWFEFKQKEVQHAPLLTEAPLKPFQSMNILLVDDNMLNRIVTSKILTSWNISMDVAENGREAIEKISNNDYHFVLMDIHMPVMGGIEATRKIRNELAASKRNIPIITYSASINEREKQEAQQAGVNDFIQKPFKPAVLHQKISQLIQLEEVIMDV